MREDDALHQMARMAMTNGKLPSRASDRMWAGMGNGVRCSICETSIGAGEADWELEFTRGNGRVDTYHVHVPCFHAWERARTELEAAAKKTPLSKPAKQVNSAGVGDPETRRARSS